MVEAVVVRCDRCGAHVAGLRSPEFTSGFYDMSAEPWSRYAEEGEQTVCDSCIQDDPRYQADYVPSVRNEDTPEAIEARHAREEGRRKLERERIAAARARWLKEHGSDT